MDAYLKVARRHGIRRDMTVPDNGDSFLYKNLLCQISWKERQKRNDHVIFSSKKLGNCETR